MRRIGARVAFGLAVGLGLTVAAPRIVTAVESPTSYGEAARVDTPVLRIPFLTRPPKIDGVMTEGEWEDSSALSGFWYDFAQADFRFLAPPQTQLQLYAGYDKENLYFCYSSPVYPENSWLKARGRFPDVLSHPLYGMLWDDHHELELRPFPDLAKAVEYMATLQNEKEVTAVDEGGRMGVKGAEVKIRGSKTTKSWLGDEPPVFACAIQPIYEVAWNHYANRLGLGAKMPNVQELLNSQNVWWIQRATPGRAYRPEPFRENGMFGWGTLTHSNLGQPQKAAATTK